MGDQVTAAARRPARPWSPVLPHSPGLDGVRAVAVLAVLGYHLDLAVLGGGFLGVEVFFTLSGFLITQLLIAELRHRGRVDAARFAAARARRLVPALVACVAGTVLAHRLLFPAEAADLRADALAGLLYVQNWHLVVAGVPYGAAFDPSPLLHLWSLGVEGQLYVLWPLLFVGVLALSRWRVAATAVLAVLAAVAMAVQYDPADTTLAYYATGTRASGFLVGAALAMLWRPQSWVRPRTRGRRYALDALGLAGLTVLLWLLVSATEFDDALYERGGFLLTGLATAGLVVAASLRSGLVVAALSRPVLTWLGRRSYGIYLYHWPILVLSRPAADLPGEAAVLADVARVAAVLLVAEASYRWLETPLRRAVPRPAAGRRRAVAARYALTTAGAVGGVAVVLAATTVPVVSGMASLALPLPAGGAAGSAAPPGMLTGALAPGTAAGLAARVPAPAGAAPPAQPVSSGPPVLVVGDSIALGSEGALRGALGPTTTVDAAVGRQFADALPIVQAWAAAHDGPVVVGLGANGTVQEDDVAAVVAAAGPRRVVLLGVCVPRRWQDPNNTVLRTVAAQNAPRVVFVDWAALLAGRPGMLGPDRVHPTRKGQALLADSVAAGVRS
ncbi:acyltransferase family protein [Pseudonocardia sp.]|uniref:acyltransferase family protein n=1 Tax=Pseudonocardia sp. TaxID=60912 RepID=UPI003D0D7CD2